VKRKSYLSRNSALKAKQPADGRIAFSSFSKPGKQLERARFKRKLRRAKLGDDPARKAFVKLFPCVVGGKKCPPCDPHHEIDGHGENRKGMGQTANDARTFPMCRGHHEDFHHGRGFCKGWSKEQRRTFQEQEIERFQKIWAEYQDTGVLVEPLQEAI